MADILLGLKEFSITFFFILYYWIQAIILAFIPSSWRAKDVAGETVLVTGAGVE